MAVMETGFGGNTLILSSSGYRKAEDIIPCDSVMGRDGLFHEVVSTSEKTGKLYSIRAFSSSSFEATGNMKLLVRLRNSYITRKSASDYRYITVGDLLREEDGVPLYKKYLVALPISTAFGYLEWQGVYIDRGIGPKLEKKLDVTDDRLWYLVGIFLKSGNIQKNYRKGPTVLPYSGLYITSQAGKAESVIRLIPPTFHCTISERSSKNTDRIDIANSELAMFMKDFGNKLSEKTCPAFVYSLPTSACRAIIAGFFRANDNDLSEYREKGRECRMTVSNPGLALSLCYLVLKGFCIPCTVYRVKASATRTIGERTFTMGDFYQIDFKLSPTGTPQALFERGFYWHPLRLIEPMGQGKVISISTEDGNGIIGAGMVAEL